MHHHRHHHRHHHGPRFPNRHDLLARLESYQRDLEQELADIADLIAHLRHHESEAQPAEQA
jgi:hypothetical protein